MGGSGGGAPCGSTSKFFGRVESTSYTSHLSSTDFRNARSIRYRFDEPYIGRDGKEEQGRDREREGRKEDGQSTRKGGRALEERKGKKARGGGCGGGETREGGSSSSSSTCSWSRTCANALHGGQDWQPRYNCFRPRNSKSSATPPRPPRPQEEGDCTAAGGVKHNAPPLHRRGF